MNLNELAKEVTLAEGKKISLPIGQVKEVIRLVLDRLAEEARANPLGLMKVLAKRKKV
jgi:hypothetical protein